MKSQAVKAWLSFMLLLLAGYGGYTLWKVSRANDGIGPQPTRVADGSLPPPKDARLEDFSFSDQLGGRVELKQFKGKVWVASFFFAGCVGPCMTMNNAVAKLCSELGDSKLGPNGVTFVSVTVDPLNDTTERLARYADHFQADPKSWLFLTGPYESARSLGENFFHVTVQGQMHSERLMLIDREGKVVRTYHGKEPADMESLKQKIEELLGKSPTSSAAEKSPETDRTESREPAPLTPAAKEPS